VRVSSDCTARDNVIKKVSLMHPENAFLFPELAIGFIALIRDRIRSIIWQSASKTGRKSRLASVKSDIYSIVLYLE
jgi:hypothetical protein